MAEIRYTQKEMDQLLLSFIITADTREQNNNHILESFKARKRGYITRKLDFGDYSFFLPENESLGIPHDLHFSDELVIERKANLDELCGNLKVDNGERQRFKAEMLRKGDAKMMMVIETGGWEDLFGGNYRSKYSTTALAGSLLSFQHRYDLHLQFVPKNRMGEYIAYNFYYYLRDRLKTGFLGTKKEV